MTLSYVFEDLSQLPTPTIVESIDYEKLLAQRLAEFNGLAPLFLNAEQQPVVLPAEWVQTEQGTVWQVPLAANAGLYYVNLDSDPVTRLIQIDTYRELLLRQRINQAALATMPAFATGTDLDQLALRYGGLTRKTLIPANPNALPPAPAVMESDLVFRKRVLLAPEKLAHGGPEGWYLARALDVDGVKDAYVSSPSKTEVLIYVLGYEGDGTASTALQSTVLSSVTEQQNKPLGDKVSIQSATIVNYSITATIAFYEGVVQSGVIAGIKAAWSRFRQISERIGHPITDSGVKAALHQSGVFRVVIDETLPVPVGSTEAPFNTALILLGENGEPL